MSFSWIGANRWADEVIQNKKDQIRANKVQRTMRTAYEIVQAPLKVCVQLQALRANRLRIYFERVSEHCMWESFRDRNPQEKYERYKAELKEKLDSSHEVHFGIPLLQFLVVLH